MRIVDWRKKGYHGELSLYENDKLRTHLQIVRCDQTSPENGHDVASTDVPIPDELRAEPKSLDKHCHCHELCSGSRRAPHSVKLL
jgi:hypothetical protein